MMSTGAWFFLFFIGMSVVVVAFSPTRSRVLSNRSPKNQNRDQLDRRKDGVRLVLRTTAGSCNGCELLSMSKAETGKFNRREAINLSIFSSMRLIGIGVGVGVVGAANPGAAVAATGNPWETSPIQTSPVLEKIRKLEQTEKVRGFIFFVLLLAADLSFLAPRRPVGSVDVPK
jgi:hypothetical protein